MHTRVPIPWPSQPNAPAQPPFPLQPTHPRAPCRLCTWLSVDGGVTWKDVAVGAYIYEYADFGGLLIMAKHPGSSDTPTGAWRQRLRGRASSIQAPLARPRCVAPALAWSSQQHLGASGMPTGGLR